VTLCRKISYFVTLVIDAPGVLLSNNKSGLLSHCGSELIPSFDMGDGKEGERQPLLKNKNISVTDTAYSSQSDAIGINTATNCTERCDVFFVAEKS